MYKRQQLPRMREKVRKLEKEVQALAAAGRAGKSEDGGTEEDGNEPSK